MINQISKNIAKKYDQIGALLLSCLAHILLLAVFFLSYSKDDLKPKFTVLDVSIISANQKSENAGKIRPKSAPQNHKTSEQNKVTANNSHAHSAEEIAEVSGGAKKFGAVHNPLPQIPDDLRVEAFQSEAVARFYIDAQGGVEKVELIKPCANPRLNKLLLKSLHQWKFPPAKQASTQDILVKFRVD